MIFNPEKHCRRSVRLKGHDYSRPGVYFITICSWLRHSIFGEIINNKMQLNDYGMAVYECWHGLLNHYFHIELDECVIMPNHMHCIINIVDTAGAGFEWVGLKPSTTSSQHATRHGLSEIVGVLKTFSSIHINQIRNMIGKPVWQRHYFEYIIRNENELNKIRDYIKNNPSRWAFDNNNPLNIQIEPELEIP